MAADTRENASTKESPPVAAGSAKSTQLDVSAVPVAPPNENALPAGAGQNTAGAKVREAGVVDALRSIKPTEFSEVHKKPCVRDALLTGIGGGFGIGGLRAIWGGMLFCQAQRYLNHSADGRSHCLVEL